MQSNDVFYCARANAQAFFNSCLLCSHSLTDLTTAVSAGWLLVLKPPIIVLNSLPVPVVMEVHPSCVRYVKFARDWRHFFMMNLGQSGRFEGCVSTRLNLDLRGSGHILQLSAVELDSVTLLAHGYKSSKPIKVPKLEQKSSR